MKIRHLLWGTVLNYTHKLRIYRWSQRKLLREENLITQFKPLAYREREFLESCLPLDFKPESTKKVTACIVSSTQEIDLLPLSTEAILASQEKSIDKCILVAPGEQIDSIKKVIPSEFSMVADEDLMSTELGLFIDQNFPKDRRGWIKQQILKILAAKKLGGEGTLLVDADTILLRPQNWLSSEGVQNLQVSVEYHQPYQEQYERFMLSSPYNNRKLIGRTKVSFVTHHQLMQASILDEIFGYKEEVFQEGLQRWLRSVEFSKSNSPACEWHTYGTFMASNFPSRIHLTQWRNLGLSRFSLSPKRNLRVMDLSVENLFCDFAGWNSLSLHHYIEHP
jgi:Family of unknown function (DUF6492)